MTDLVFLGCGAGYKPSLGPTAAYFITGRRLYILECGTSVFERLDRAGAFIGISSVTIFLSHLHADHTGSLGILLDYCKDILHIRPILAHPSRNIISFLDIIGASRESYTWYADYAEPDENGVHATFYPVTHALGMDCFGYLINIGKLDSFYYSGDANSIPEEVLTLLFNGSLNRIYQDTASASSQHHCPLEKLKILVPEEFRSRVYCVHLDTDCPDVFLEAGFRTLSE